MQILDIIRKQLMGKIITLSDGRQLKVTRIDCTFGTWQIAGDAVHLDAVVGSQIRLAITAVTDLEVSE